jgi:hypothetical protein
MRGRRDEKGDASMSGKTLGVDSITRRDRVERQQLRQTHRSRIEEFFRRHIGLRVASSDLHSWFGSSFRTRVSEINRDPTSRIAIVNETAVAAGEFGQRREQSFYRAEARKKISWPATFAELEKAGYVYLGGKECECGSSFLWWRTPAGKAMPISVIEGDRLVPHHAVCENVKRFRAANATHAARVSTRPSPPPLQASLF